MSEEFLNDHILFLDFRFTDSGVLSCAAFGTRWKKSRELTLRSDVNDVEDICLLQRGADPTSKAFLQELGEKLFSIFPPIIQQLILDELSFAEQSILNSFSIHFSSFNPVLEKLWWEVIYDSTAGFGFIALNCSVTRNQFGTSAPTSPHPLLGPLNVGLIGLNRPATESCPSSFKLNPIRNFRRLDDIILRLNQSYCHVLCIQGEIEGLADPKISVSMGEDPAVAIDIVQLAFMLDSLQFLKVVILIPTNRQGGVLSMDPAVKLAASCKRACLNFRRSPNELEMAEVESTLFSSLSIGESLNSCVVKIRQALAAKNLRWELPVLVSGKESLRPFQQRRDTISLVNNAMSWGNRDIVEPKLMRYVLDDFDISRLSSIAISSDLFESSARKRVHQKAPHTPQPRQDPNKQINLDNSLDHILGSTNQSQKAVTSVGIDGGFGSRQALLSNVSFPGRIQVGEWHEFIFSLKPEQTPKQSSPHFIGATDLLVEEAFVEVVITTSGLDVSYQNDRRQFILGPDNQFESLTILFRAPDEGTYEVSVSYMFAGSYSGTTVLTIEAVPNIRNASHVARSSQSLRLVTCRGRAAVFFVRHYETNGNHSVGFFFYLPDGKVHSSCTRFNVCPKQWIRSKTRSLDRRQRSSRLDESYFEMLGHELFDLLPLPVQQDYWDNLHAKAAGNDGDSAHLLIVTNEQSIPWELMKPYLPDADADYLCHSFAVGRFAPEFDSSTSIVIDEIRACAAMSNPSGIQTPVARQIGANDGISEPDDWLGNNRTLKSALSLRERGIVVEVIPARSDSLLTSLQRSGFQLLYVEDRGGTAKTGLSSSSIQLQDGEYLASDFDRAASDFGPGEPIVIINKFHSNQKQFTLSGTADWADAFRRSGCGPFVGVSWTVKDDQAGDFAELLFDELMQGQFTFGEVMRRTRVKLRKRERNNDRSQLNSFSYVLFGNPTIRVRMAGHQREDR